MVDQSLLISSFSISLIFLLNRDILGGFVTHTRSVLFSEKKSIFTGFLPSFPSGMVEENGAPVAAGRLLLDHLESSPQSHLERHRKRWDPVKVNRSRDRIYDLQRNHQSRVLSFTWSWIANGIDGAITANRRSYLMKCAASFVWTSLSTWFSTAKDNRDERVAVGGGAELVGPGGGWITDGRLIKSRHWISIREKVSIVVKRRRTLTLKRRSSRGHPPYLPPGQWWRVLGWGGMGGGGAREEEGGKGASGGK